MRPTTANEHNCFNLSALFHPHAVFDHPRDVLAHPGLSVGEKRAILASWASDASAVASCPSLRMLSPAKLPVTIDDIFDALEALDEDPHHPPGGKPARLHSVDRLAA